MINSEIRCQYPLMGDASLVLPAPVDAAQGAAQGADVTQESDAGNRLRAMVDQHYSFVWRSVRRLGVDMAGADDAAQQVFITASRKLATILLGGERPYLFGIALRVASDARRRNARRREQVWEDEGDAIDPAPLPDELLDARRARAMLDEALDAMSIDLRVVFTLHELEELPMSEIAELVEIPPGTVASRLRRAREEFETIVTRLTAKRERLSTTTGRRGGKR